MKLYFHLCVDGFTNSYTILNDRPDVKEAIIVDPGKIDMETINLIQLHEETISCNLKAFDKYSKKHYTLKGINDFMANIASQKDASLYFPINSFT